MRAALLETATPNRAFVIERLGTEALRLLPGAAQPAPAPSASAARTWAQRARAKAHRIADRLREKCACQLLGKDYANLALGRFRLGGEVHLWMYDRFSLARALEAAGFVKPAVCSASTSSFPDWARYGLDVEPDGSTYKPDSLFMEAHKP
jgi:hypothetical protein